MFYAAGGLPMSNAVEYSFYSSYKENQITRFYKRPVSLKMNTTEFGYLTDILQLNDVSIESNHLDKQLKKVSKRTSNPTTLPPTTPPSSYSSSISSRQSISSISSKSSSNRYDTSSTQSKYSKPYTRSPSQRTRQKRKYITRKPRIESNPLYPVAMSRRRNYTFHYPMGSTSFKREARINLLNTTNHISQQLQPLFLFNSSTPIITQYYQGIVLISYSIIFDLSNSYITLFLSPP